MIYAIVQDQNFHLRFYLSRYLKQKRMGLDISQLTAAEAVGLTLGQYRSVESGKAKLTIQTLERLYDLLRLDMAELWEVVRISKVAYANAVTKELSRNYPE